MQYRRMQDKRIQNRTMQVWMLLGRKDVTISVAKPAQALVKKYALKKLKKMNNSTSCSRKNTF